VKIGEERGLRVGEKRMLRIFGPKKDDVAGGCESYITKSFVICTPSQVQLE
jgi:hypothetical protein